MYASRTSGGRRAARRLLAVAVLSVGVIAGSSVSASAAVTATFNAGTLSVFGDSLNNSITVSRNAAGQILVNGGAVAVAGGTPTVANTSQIQVFGQGGKTRSPSARSTAHCRGPTSSAAPATTCSPAAPAPTSSSARPATTRCSARAAPTCCSAATTTTR